MRPRRRPMLLATAVVLALVALVAVALAGGFDTITTKRVRGSGTRVVRVELVDAILGFDVTPDVIEVNPGTHLVLRLINDGDEIHDLALYGGATRTRMLDPGESHRLDVGTVTEDVEACARCPATSSSVTVEIRVAHAPRAGAGPRPAGGASMPSPQGSHTCGLGSTDSLLLCERHRRRPAGARSGREAEAKPGGALTPPPA